MDTNKESWQLGPAFPTGTRGVMYDLSSGKPVEESSATILPDGTLKLLGDQGAWPNPNPAKTGSEYLRWAIIRTEGDSYSAIGMFAPDGSKMSAFDVFVMEAQ